LKLLIYKVQIVGEDDIDTYKGKKSKFALKGTAEDNNEET